MQTENVNIAELHLQRSVLMLLKCLRNTEIRAQNAEKEIIDLQENLNSANQKIRSMEKKVDTS